MPTQHPHRRADLCTSSKVYEALTELKQLEGHRSAKLVSLLAQHLVHKTVLSVLSWLLFGGLLLGRWRYGWRGIRAVHWTLAAMALLLLAFFGSKFVLELVLATP